MRHVLLLLAMMALAACGSSARDSAAPAPSPATPAQAQQPQVQQPAAAQAKAADAQDLSTLERATPEQVRLRLGNPQEIRASGRGQIWTYRRPLCSAEIYLNPPRSYETRLVVLGSKLMPDNLHEPNRSACMKQLFLKRSTE